MEYMWRSDLSNARRAAAQEGNDEPQSSDPGAPALSATLEGPANMSLGKKINIVAHITLEGNKPVTFHTHRIKNTFRMFRRRVQGKSPGDRERSDATWVPGDDDETPRYFIADDADGTDLSAGPASEDHLHVRFTGVELGWWDWGDADAHDQTEAWLPCFISGDVIDPRDNNGRPKARVGGLRDVEFVIED
ncbi:hypothetical protein JDV02_000374 [Purpureocillium takamizusanense]|uniref:Uncharacterized protein n=1 Tax=Purpureocillium takamizusanense TaxID=2060973 RepID=A0A9Q8Q703_9HYPO|nr:uncharacterized protein JDV02_000374 [Purpureocillium takamizusanense]UNI13651.1 hypothetical protein JDV02_000374 [Purpureocillium takamizusanense]